MSGTGSFDFPEPPLLSRAVFDRADALRSDPAALTDGWPAAQILLIDRRGRYPVDASGALRWSAAAEVAAAPPAEAIFLGVAGTHRWALAVDDLTEPVGELRTGAHLLGADDAGLLATALGLLNWHRSAEFSPVDGSRTTVDKAGWVRRNPATGHEEYPRTDPAVIMVVHDGADQVLLGRQQVWPQRWFSTLAGFVEPGESAEQTVLREVAEETGVSAHSPRYLGSQPWPFPRSLMLGFEAVADPGQPIAPVDGELAEARWFHREQVRAALAGEWGADDGAELLLPPSVSIARSLIAGWAGGPQR